MPIFLTLTSDQKQPMVGSANTADSSKSKSLTGVVQAFSPTTRAKAQDLSARRARETLNLDASATNISYRTGSQVQQAPGCSWWCGEPWNPGSCWLDNLRRNAVSLKADKMAQQTKGFASKPEDQNSILGAHIAERADLTGTCKLSFDHLTPSHNKPNRAIKISEYRTYS